MKPILEYQAEPPEERLVYSQKNAIKGIHGALYQLDAIAAVSIGLAWVLAPEWLLEKQVFN